MTRELAQVLVIPGRNQTNIGKLLILADQARAAAEDTFTYGVMHERQACQAAGIEQELAHARREELSV